jgi:hypothetical protein
MMPPPTRNFTRIKNRLARRQAEEHYIAELTAIFQLLR